MELPNMAVLPSFIKKGTVTNMRSKPINAIVIEKTFCALTFLKGNIALVIF